MSGLVKLCKSILEVCALTKGETFVLVTSNKYDVEYASAMINAAAEIGAVGAHLAVIPKLQGVEYVKGITPWHWDIYATADLLISCRVGSGPRTETPQAITAYNAKIGNHEFKTDHDFLNRIGSKTRWIDLNTPPHIQRQYFPTPERAELTIEGAKIMHKAKELRYVSKSGSDFTLKKDGRPGHAQIGYAATPGRWDNFGYGCVATGTEQGEGTIIIEPGDVIPPLTPDPIVVDPIKLTWEGGYVTKIEGGVSAKVFRRLMATYNDKEAYGMSHIGWGTHEKASWGEGTIDDVSAYHHSAIGTMLFALGVNYGHGLGGPDLNYSGLGDTQRRAPNHTHFTLHGGDFYCDDEKIVDDGKLLM